MNFIKFKTILLYEKLNFWLIFSDKRWTLLLIAITTLSIYSCFYIKYAYFVASKKFSIYFMLKNV
jgi:hypothetical protein